MKLMGESEEGDIVVNKVLLLNNEPQEEKEDDHVKIEEIDEKDSKEEEEEEGVRRRNVHSRVCNKRTNSLSLSESSLNASIPFFVLEASALASAGRFRLAGLIVFPIITFGFSL